MPSLAKAYKSQERLAKERRLILVRESNRRQRAIKSSRNTRIGFVCPDKGHTHTIHKVKGRWAKTKLEADVYLAAKLERVVKSNKRFIIVIGGRGSTKSVGIADLDLIAAKDDGSKTYCLREYQSSIKNSVQSLLADEVERLEFDDFEVMGQSMLYQGKEAFQFAGLARNVDSIKSAHGFKRFSIEEAQFISSQSLTALTPTARNKPNKGLPMSKKAIKQKAKDDPFAGVSMTFIANPGSAADPFSQRFIQPFLKDIMAKGYYEDDLHLIVKIDHEDNPWFAESGLDKERQYDKEHMSEGMYDHVWNGAYNDDVENSIITIAEFDAAIDAHIKLGFRPEGAIVAAHDPSDLGPDPKGYALRHGSVFTKIIEQVDGDVNEGMHTATDMAISDNADLFLWDGDGLGISLREQVSRALNGKHCQWEIFRGSESPDDKEREYEPLDGSDTRQKKTNGDTFFNKRAQYYTRMANRFKKTYRAVAKGEYLNPDDMISICSDIPDLDGLRAEVCRIPLKKGNNNGKIQIMSKLEMAKAPLRIPSPNRADAMMMTMTNPEIKTAPIKIKFTGSG